MKTSLRWTVPVPFILLALILGATDAVGQTARSHASALQSVADGSHELQSKLSILSGGSAALTTSKLEEMTAYVWEEEDWTLDAKTIYVYTELGRSATWHYVWNGSDWVSESVTKTTPGGSSYSLTVNERYDTESNEWIPVDQIRVDYLHDPGSGEPYVNWTLYQTWDGEDWLDVSRDTYNYAAAFTVEGGQTDVWDGHAWVPESRYLVAQESEDVVFVDQEWSGSAWVLTTRSIYRNWTVKDLQLKYTEIGNVLEDYEGVYYGLHMLPAAEAQEWDGSQWVNVSRQVLTYDLFTGNVSEVITQEWAEDAWVPSFRIHLTYGMMLPAQTLSYDFYNGSSWTTLARESYTYDEEGSISEVTQQHDAGEGPVNSAKFVFTWDHVASSAEGEGVPTAYALDPAYPNPFNPETHITYRLATSGHVGVRVYDALGRLVATLVDGPSAAGTHTVTFAATNLPSGQYIVRLEAPGYTQARVITLLK